MPLPSIDFARLAELAAGWLSTYLLHSTLLLAAAWLACRTLPNHHLAVRESLWRTALLGGILSASLQLGLGVEPLAGTLRLDPGRSAAPAAALAAPAPPLTVGAGLPVASTPPAGDAPSRVAHASPLSGRAWLAFLWLAGASPLVILFAVSWLRLRRRLRGRRAVGDAHLLGALADLRAAGGIHRPVRLTSDRGLAVPIALGLRRWEICLPERALAQLGRDRQETILAHELAHLARRDPAWLLLGRLLECLLFLQPLNRLARRRLQEISELRCDDWAVARTGRPLALARSLTEVASWALGRAPQNLVPAMAGRGRTLSHRVARLLERDYPRPSSPRPRWLGPVLVALLVLAAVVVPRVSVGQDAAPAAAPPPPAVAPLDTGPPPAAAPVEVAGPAAVPPASAPPAAAPRAEASPAEAPPAPADVPPPRQPSVPAPPSLAPPPPAPPAEAAPPQAPALAAPPPAPPAPPHGARPALAPDEAWAKLADDLTRHAHELVERSRLTPELEAQVHDLERRAAEVTAPDAEALARLQVLATEAGKIHLDPAALAEVETLAREVVERALDPELTARLQAAATRLAASARPDERALAELQRDARELTERLGAQQEELAGQARRLAQQLRSEPPQP